MKRNLQSEGFLTGCVPFKAKFSFITDARNMPLPHIVVFSGLTALSTIFQSYHDGVWLRQGAQCSLL